MFFIYDARGTFYKKTSDEFEADTIAYQIGGYYVESGAY